MAKAPSRTRTGTSGRSRPAEETGADCMGPPWRWGPLPLAGQNDSHGPHSRQDEPCHLPKVPGVEAAQEQTVLHAPEDRLRVLHTALVWHGDDDTRGCEEAEEPIRWRVEPVAFTNREVPRSPAKPEECSPQPRRTGPLSDVNAAEDNPATGRAQLKAVGKDNHFGDGGQSLNPTGGESQRCFRGSGRHGVPLQYYRPRQPIRSMRRNSAWMSVPS